MKPTIYIFIFFSSFLLYSQQCGWQWYSPYPQGNPINDIFFLDSLTGIAIGDHGTTIKTTNAGIDWMIKPSNSISNLKSLSSSSNNNLWVVGYANVGYNPSTTILKSTDSGDSWAVQITIPNRKLISIKFLNNNIGWVVGDTGYIYKTTDGGSSWYQQISETNYLLQSVFFINSDVGWVVGNDNYGNSILKKTTNGGINWISQSTPLPMGYNDIYFLNSNIGWLCGGGGCIFKTTNGGLNWISSYYPDYYLSKIRALDSSYIICIGQSGKVYLSTNSGLTWNNRNLQVKPNGLYALYIKDILTYYTSGTTGAIFKTTNAGLNWSTKKCLSVDQLKTIKYFDNDTGIIGSYQNFVINNLSQIFHSYNRGLGWSGISFSASPLFTYDFATPNIGWYTTLYGYLKKTINGGNTWTTQSIGTSNVMWSIQCNDTNICFVAGDGGIIKKTTNGGLNWITLNAGTNYQLMSIFFIDFNIGWIGGYNGILKKTTNGGISWVSQTSGTTNEINNVFFLTSNIGWFCTNFNEINKTTNGGLTWTLQTNASDNVLSEIFFIDTNHGWVCGSQGSILKTTNGGSNWVIETTGSSSDIFCLYANDTNDVWAGDINGGILHYTYYVQKPFLISPPNNKDTLPLYPLQLKWHSVENAISYTVQVSADSNFVSNLWNQTVQIDTTTLYPNLIYNTTYYWRVRGTDTAGRTSLWSDVWNFKTGEQVTQQIPLVPTWNMISSYLNPADTNFASIMSQLGSNLILAKDGLGNVFWNQWGIDDIQSWNLYNGYQLYVLSADTLTITGTLADPLQSPMSLGSGWYLISYLRNNIMPPSTALQSIQNKFIILKDGDGNVYWPDWGIEDIINMQPGQGYQIYMNQEGNLIYPPN